MKALLLSAGLGTRLRPYTNKWPKPCIPFLGIPLSWYSLYLLHQAGCNEVVVNLHHLPDKVQALYKKSAVKKFFVEFSLEKEKAMGSGGALYYAKGMLNSSESFFAINGDEVFIPSRSDILKSLDRHHKNTRSLATLLVTNHPDLGKTLKPIWIDDAGNVVGFGLTQPASKVKVRPVHYTGCKIFSKKVLTLIPPGETHIFLDTLAPAIAKGAVVNTVFDDCLWWETGDFKAFLKATGDVIELIHRSPGKNYFRDVYEFFQKPFALVTEVNGERKIAHHVSVTLDRAVADGVVFVDSSAQLSPGTRLHNTIVNSGAVARGTLTDTMVFPEEV